MPASKKIKNALDILRRDIGDDGELRNLVQEERINVRIARLIHDARESAGLSQKELADLLGTGQSAISRLEDADYEGHSISMLNRIATALNLRLVVDLKELEHEESAT